MKTTKAIGYAFIAGAVLIALVDLFRNVIVPSFRYIFFEQPDHELKWLVGAIVMLFVGIFMCRLADAGDQQ